jgi:hypothetical protein
MPTPAQKRKLDDLYNEAEKAIAAGDKERHEHGYLSPQTKDWIDHAEQERDEYEEKIDPPNDIPTRYKAN